MISPVLLEKRMKHLVDKGHTFLPLDESIQRLAANDLPNNSVVITVDDGFQTTPDIAHPVFKKFNIPYTVYVTTYYVDKELPLINLIVQYAAWKSKFKRVDLSPLGLSSNYLIKDSNADTSVLASVIKVIDSGTEAEKKGLTE